MRKLIHSSFELDLSSFGISDTEENNWFNTEVTNKYTLPFQIDLALQFDVATDFISLYNANPQTIFEVFYCHDGLMELATLEITEDFEGILQCELAYGYDELPSWDKKLSELSLQKFDITSGDIYDHAETIITQGWPNVNYNFPQIFTDKIDTESDTWFAFEKIINNRKDGAFLENTVDTIENIVYNRNIIQPLPYWLHVLSRGIADAGFELAGDILQDPIFQKLLLYADVDYFTSFVEEPMTVVVLHDDHISTFNRTVFSETRTYGVYEYALTLPAAGKYKLSGTFTVPGNFNHHNGSIGSQSFFFKIYLQGFLIYSFVDYSNGNQNIQIIFETFGSTGPFEMTFELQSFVVGLTTMMDFTIEPLYMFGVDGDVVPSIFNENKIDLTRAVPDITFGEFYKITTNWFNYGHKIVGNQFFMNRLNNEINYHDAVDFTKFEKKYPLRKFQKQMSFLLKFTDIDSKEYKYLPVFHDVNQVTNQGYKTNNKTNPIEINALPLPSKSVNTLQTAFAFENNSSKPYAVLYDGLQSGKNTTLDYNPLLLPIVHQEYWQKWFEFRINAQFFNWTFDVWKEEIINFDVKTKIFAYGRYHLIKILNKTEISPNLYELDIETETLP